MDLDEQNHNEELVDHSEECAEESAGHLLLSSFPDDEGIYGGTPVPPRLGDGFQAEIPPLLTESERLQLEESPFNITERLGSSYCFGVGLDIPIMWVNCAGVHVKHELPELVGTPTSSDGTVPMKFLGNGRSLLDSKCFSLAGYPPFSRSHNMLPHKPTCKAELPKELLEHGQNFAGITGQECDTNDHKDAGLLWRRPNKTATCFPLPGSPVVPWSDVEAQSFLLALYIFGKNLLKVKKLMGGKEMGDILSFYYGKFYRSDSHRRWSDCVKMRGRRCIHGQRIFTGWRQPELLSRMLPRIPVEAHKDLLQAAKYFSEGTSSFDEFIFTLKTIVGMQLLVEAVGIGKGKHDLTGTLLDPGRSNQVFSTRPELPVGKACSSLTPGEIVKFLTGGFRLSKARSNDLFWEAVWPRLLDRGWHSEQPKDLSSTSSKNALVFLIPGIKKFSRKKLTKGIHYFNSVSDVLHRVALDPRLLELQAEGAKGSGSDKDENRWEMGTNLDRNTPSEPQRHCYLRPRLPNCNSEIIKFTVVDTSAVQEGGPVKVRELKSLPMDDIHSYRSSNCLGETDAHSSEELPDSDISPNDQEKFTASASNDKKFGNSKKCTMGNKMLSDHLISGSKRRRVGNEHDSEEQFFEVLNDNDLVKDTVCHFDQRLNYNEVKRKPPVSKRRRLTACSSAGTGRRSYSSPRVRQSKKVDPRNKQKAMEVNEPIGAEVGPSRGKMSTSSSMKGSVDESSECYSNANFLASSAVGETISQEKHQAGTLIDLNLPQFPPDFDTGERLCAEMASCQDGPNTVGHSFPSQTNQLYDGPQEFDTSDGMSIMQHPNSRRQSTRNRPPTTKALEALACGFLSTKRKWRGSKGPPSDDLAPKPPRRARNTVGAASTNHFNVTSPKTMISDILTNEMYHTVIDHGSMGDESWKNDDQAPAPAAAKLGNTGPNKMALDVGINGECNTRNHASMGSTNHFNVPSPKTLTSDIVKNEVYHTMIDYKGMAAESWKNDDQAPVVAAASRLCNTSPNKIVSDVGINGECNTRNYASMDNQSHVWSGRKEDNDLSSVLYCSEVLD